MNWLRNWLRNMALIVVLLFLHYFLVVWVLVGDPDKGQWYAEHGNLWYAVSAMLILACVVLLVNVLRLQHVQNKSLREIPLSNCLELPAGVVGGCISFELFYYFIFSRSWHDKISTYVMLAILMSWGIGWFLWYRKHRNKQEAQEEEVG